MAVKYRICVSRDPWHKGDLRFEPVGTNILVDVIAEFPSHVAFTEFLDMLLSQDADGLTLLEKSFPHDRTKEQITLDYQWKRGPNKNSRKSRK